MKEIVKKIIAVLTTLAFLILGYFAIPDDGLNRMFTFLKWLLKLGIWIFIFGLFIYFLFYLKKLAIVKIEELEKENEKLKLDKKQLSDEVEKLKKVVEELKSTNKLSEKWKKDFEEFKTLTFFDKFENIIKWVKNDQDYYSLYSSHANYSALFDYCKNDEILIINEQDLCQDGDYGIVIGKKTIIKFTEKGQFFAKEFIKEKNKKPKELPKPIIRRFISYH